MKIRLLALLTCAFSLCAQDVPATAPVPAPVPVPPAGMPQLLQGKFELEINGKKETVDLTDPATALRFKDKVIVVTEINGQREVRVVDAKDVEKLPAPFFWNEKPPVRTGPVTFLGIGAIEVPAEVAAQLTLPPDTGLQIAVVLPESPAAKAGFQESDIVQKFEDQIVITPRQLAILIANRKEGDAVKLSIIRKGQPMEITATLGKRDIPHTAESKERVANVTRKMVKLEGDAEKAIKLLESVNGTESVERRFPSGRIQIRSGTPEEMKELRERTLRDHLKEGYQLENGAQKKPVDPPAVEDTGKAVRDALDKLSAEERAKIIKDLLRESDALPKNALPQDVPEQQK